MTASDNLRDYYGRELLLKCDKNGKIKYVSENSIKILGYSQDEIINTYINYEIDRVFKNSSDGKDISYKFYKKDGTEIILDINISTSNIGNGTEEYIISIIDVTKHVEILNDKEALMNIFHTSKDIIYKIEAKPEFKFVYLSPGIYEVLGYSPEEHYANPNLLMEIMYPDDIEYMKNKIMGNFDYSKPTIARYLHKNGVDYIWLEDYCNPVYNDEGEIIEFQGVSRDITLRKKFEEELEKKIYCDSLTGLYNRAYLEKQIKILNKQSNTKLGIFFLDLDNLKVVNDTLGHEYGDKLIIAISDVLKDIFRENSYVFRIGGDEFVVIVKDILAKDMDKLCDILVNYIEERNSINPELQVKVSFGYSYCDDINHNIMKVINEADENMYKNKKYKKMAAL